MRCSPDLIRAGLDNTALEKGEGAGEHSVHGSRTGTKSVNRRPDRLASPLALAFRGSCIDRFAPGTTGGGPTSSGVSSSAIRTALRVGGRRRERATMLTSPVAGLGAPAMGVEDGDRLNMPIPCDPATMFCEEAGDTHICESSVIEPGISPISAKHKPVMSKYGPASYAAQNKTLTEGPRVP